jgi:hypothetical protein
MFMPSVFKWLGLRPIFTAIWETKPVQAMLTPLEAILTFKKWGQSTFEFALVFLYAMQFCFTYFLFF